jgi:hypothetical protein
MARKQRVSDLDALMSRFYTVLVELFGEIVAAVRHRVHGGEL